MELLGWIAMVFLAALGLLELVRMAVFWMLRPQRPHRGERRGLRAVDPRRNGPAAVDGLAGLQSGLPERG